MRTNAQWFPHTHVMRERVLVRCQTLSPAWCATVRIRAVEPQVMIPTRRRPGPHAPESPQSRDLRVTDPPVT